VHKGGRNKTQDGEGVGDVKTDSSVKGLASALLILASVLALATGVQAQSAAEVQTAIAILTDASNSLQDRINAARDLAVFGQDSNVAAQALIGVLSSDPNPAVRSASALALGSAAFPSTSSIEALIQALNSDSSPEVRRAAVQGLDVVGVDAPAALQALQNAAQNDPDPGVCQAARVVYNRFSSNR
jgi:HEAT repeat protein